MTVIAGFLTMLFTLVGWLLYAAAALLAGITMSAQWIVPAWSRQSWEHHRNIRALGAGATIVVFLAGAVMLGIGQAIAR